MYMRIYEPKIYYAASIRSGRDNVVFYKAGIEECEKFGRVLTKHIGDKNLTSYGEKGPSNSKIYRRDRNWLLSSDVVIIDVTVPSTGVGREIEMAKNADKSMLCLSKVMPRGRRLSPMVTGDDELSLQYYRDATEMRNIISAYLTGMGYGTKRLDKNRLHE